MRQQGARYCFLLLFLSLAFTLICSVNAMAGGPTYQDPSILVTNGTTGPLPNFYSDPLTYTLNNNLPNGELFFNTNSTGTSSGQFYRGEGSSLIPPVSGINSDALYTNSTVCTNMNPGFPIWNGTAVNGSLYAQMVSVQIGGNAASQSMNVCAVFQAAVNGTTGAVTWSFPESPALYGYVSAGNWSSLDAYALDMNLNYNPAYFNTPGSGVSGQIEGTGVSYGTAQQCMGCHGHMNVQGSDGPAFLLSGHKNALRKVIPGVPLANPSGTPYPDIDWATGQTVSGSAQAYYILGGWTGSSEEVFAQAPSYGALSIGYCARCHTTGWSPNPPNNATGTSGRNGYGSQLATQSGLEPSITALSGTTAFGAGVNGTNGTGYSAFAGVPTYNYEALPADTLNTSPYNAFGPAGAVSASWYLNGVTCERCHYSNIGTSVSSQGIEAVPNRSGVITYYEGTGSNRYGKDMAGTPPGSGGNSTNPEIVPYVANGTLAANGYSDSPQATGMNSLLLCMQCHREETVAYTNSTANITVNWPTIINQDNGSCADGSGNPYYTCIADGSTWNFAPSILSNEGTELLASPHAKYAGSPPAMNQQNSPDQSFANGTINVASNFLTINQNSTLPGTKGCTGCHDPHFTTVNVPNVPTNPSWGILYSDGGIVSTVNSPSGPQGAMPPLVSSGANSHNCNDAACHGNSMQTLNHSTGPGTPFPTGTSADFPGACFTCHMQGSSGVAQSHFFRVNPSATYYTYPTAAQFYASNGTVSLNADPTAFVLYNGTTLANGTYTYNGTTSYGTPSAAMINSAASTTYLNTGYAVANDVDIVCGQCHGGGGSTDSRGDTNPPYTNPYGIQTTGAPYFQRTYLASVAGSIHQAEGGQTQLNPVQFTPNGGSFSSSTPVTLSDTLVSGDSGPVTICYTTDSVLPTATVAGTCDQQLNQYNQPTEFTYSSPITVATTQIVEALATQANYLNSVVNSASFTIGATVATPTISIATGTYTIPVTSTLSDTLADATSGAAICYTENGSTPTASSPGTCDSNGGVEFTYSGPITVPFTGNNNAVQTLTAIATLSGQANSAVASATYTLIPAAPTFSPGSETYYESYSGVGPTVTLASNTGVTAIQYIACVAGTGVPGVGTCSASWTAGTSFVAACESGSPPCRVTYYAEAAFTGGSESSASYATYNLQPGDGPKTPHAATPTYAPAAGKITQTQAETMTVTISDSSPAPVYICYTLNGPVPKVNPATGACTIGTATASGSSFPLVAAVAATGAITESGTTATVPSTLNPTPGALVYLNGWAPSGYNGTFTVVSSNSTSFTITAATGLDTSTTTGTVTYAPEGTIYTFRAVAGGPGYLQSEPIAKWDYIFR